MQVDLQLSQLDGVFHLQAAVLAQTSLECFLIVISQKMDANFEKISRREFLSNEIFLT